MRKKKPQSESSGGEGNWMNTYGDLVTLLLTFFVLLYSFSSIDSAKWEALVVSFSGGDGVFENSSPGKKDPKISHPTTAPAGVIVAPPSLTPTPMAAITIPPAPVQTAAPTTGIPSASPTPAPPRPTTKAAPTPVPVSAGIYTEINKYLSGTSLAGGVKVEYDKSQVTVRLIASILFEPGSDHLLPEALTVLEGVAGIVGRYSKQITGLRTEGHTDSVNPPEGDIQSKWELAGRRAAHVLQYLVESCTINEAIVYTVGYGSAHPIASDSTPAGQEQNNRVDIVLTT